MTTCTSGTMCERGAEYIQRRHVVPGGRITMASLLAATDDTSSVDVEFCPFCGGRLGPETDEQFRGRVRRLASYLTAGHLETASGAELDRIAALYGWKRQ